MAITASVGNKNLLCSGIINIVMDESPVINFNVEGMIATLEIKMIAPDSNESSNVLFNVVDKRVELVHTLKPIGTSKVADAAMLIPLSIATRANGEEIFMTWAVNTIMTKEDRVVARVTYSFYEGKK